MERMQSKVVPGGAGRPLKLPMTGATLLLIWVLVWTVIFSAVDFWTLKLYDVSHFSWFEDYRALMRYGGSLVSPASFALAENAYFVWMNVYDRNYHMHEWEWYTGDPVNPDGDFNFVWGDGRGGWTKFPMKEWYGVWLVVTTAWFAALSVAFAKWRQRSTRLASDGSGAGDSSLQSA